MCSRGRAITFSAESLDLDDNLCGSFMCAPIKGRNGPVGAHPRRGTARTLAGSVRCDEVHYTRSPDRACSAANCLGFSDCGHPAFQPLTKAQLARHSRPESDLLRSERRPTGTSCYPLADLRRLRRKAFALSSKRHDTEQPPDLFTAGKGCGPQRQSNAPALSTSAIG